FTDRFTGIKAQDIPTIKLNLPTGAAFKLADCKPFSYVKIHGSINFRSAQTNQLVIGEQKDNFMQEPFMTASTKLFEEVISQPERRLLVAGYGFNDLTLNVILAQAITKASLKLYILSTMPPKDLKNTIINSGSGKMVWNGVNGYFQNSL